ncbi:MAG: hypothetical protein FD138_465 [Planctomycetota bacterium]|nr:MAG: hypothetical protein FD138_465 [Planctomycetota bacterium]
MTQRQPNRPKRPPEYGSFEDLTRKLLAVPKTELDKKLAQYEDDKKRRRKSG